MSRKPNRSPEGKSRAQAATRRWQQAHPERFKAIQANYRTRNAERIREMARRRYAETADHRRAKAREWYLKNPDKARERAQRRTAQVKLDALRAYSGDAPTCACCGETETCFLTLGHVNGDGKAHREVAGQGTVCYKWLRRNGYPKEPTLRVECYNCNLGARSIGFCPHRRRLG